MQTKSRRAIGTIIFLLGLFLGWGLALAAIWGDFEAAAYFNSGAGYDVFGGLKCPIFMSPTEVPSVSARFDNPGNLEIQPYYEVEVSGPASPRGLEGQLSVPAHAARTAQWTVDANDVDLGFFVLVKIDVLPLAGFSTREATCGILVLSLMGLSGSQIFGSTLTVSLLGLVLGLGLREIGNELQPGRAVSIRNGLRAAGVAAALAMLAGFLGWWLIGIIFCAITILLLVILLRFAGT